MVSCLFLLLLQLFFVKWNNSFKSVWKRYQSQSFNCLHSKEKTENGKGVENLTIFLLKSINEIKREKWNSLLTEDSSPFLNYDWLNTLEESGCVSINTGWDVVHLIFGCRPIKSNFISATASYDDLTIVAAMPLYVKYHSMGEFIFDQQWASFATNVLGLRYYPKILSAIPFTPGTGNRVLYRLNLTDTEIDICFDKIISSMKGLAINNKVLSANVNFMLSTELPYFTNHGYDIRETIQYRWYNRNLITGQSYKDFDDYLTCFKSKRRVQIKHERKSIIEQGVTVEVISGDDIKADQAVYETMYEIYLTTINKMWGQAYLSREFFIQLSKTSPEFRKKIVFILARNRQNKIIAGTLNFRSSTHFYGRYWGALEFVKNLHFNICYYEAIDYCIRNKLDYLEPGAGGGEYKFLRGFDPFLVYSVHYFTNPTMKAAVSDFLKQERPLNEESTQYMLSNSALGAKSKRDDANEDDR